jgi:hypothetical protein
MNKKVVVLGGGKGISYLLAGLKDFPLDITAVISVADNGQSTGKLREEFHIPAVGDIRKVITSLSESDANIKEMLAYRFHTTSDLDGHALGNLILTSLLDITGSLKSAIEELSILLDVKSKILPLTEDENITLMGEAIDGDIIEGEEMITKSPKKIKKLFYKEEPHILNEVIEALNEADLILLSMGSLYTSLFPNLLAKKLIKALDKTKAPIMYVCNIVTQPGETDNFTVSDHVNLINQYLGTHKLDVVIASNSPISQEMAEKYASEERKDPVKIDYAVLKSLDVEFIEADLLTIADNTLKHHSQKLSSLIFSYLMR